jgi:hypothetical protein
VSKLISQIKGRAQTEVCENRVLREIFGNKREEATGDYRNLFKETLSELNCPPNITRMVKSRRLMWDGHATCIREKEISTWLCWVNLKECEHLEDLARR